MSTRIGIRFVAASAMALIGCGGRASDPGRPAVEWLPLKVGASWRYVVTDAQDGSTSTKTMRVDNATTLPGVSGDVFTLITEQDGGDRTLSPHQKTAAGVVRLREDSYKGEVFKKSVVYAPAKLRVPALQEVGDSVTQSFVESTYDSTGKLTKQSSKTEVWTLEAVETLVVPAGRFDQVRRLHRVSSGSDKRFWFADGVGKLKEDGGGQTEELAGYDMP
jgi:hypothetical protein